MWFDAFAIFVADYFDVIVIVFAFVLIFVFHDPQPYYAYFSWKEVKHRMKGVLLISTAGGFAWSVTTIIKYVVQAPRPFLLFDDVNLLFPYGGFDSFPSGHATVFAALAMAMYFYNKKLGYVFAVCAVLIGLSRIVVGIHFPMDVLTGWLIGTVVSWGIYHVYHYLDDQATIEPWLKSLRS